MGAGAILERSCRLRAVALEYPSAQVRAEQPLCARLAPNQPRAFYLTERTRSCGTIASTHVHVTGVNSDAELIEMDLECSALRTALDINVMGSAMCARAALPELIKTKGQVSKARAFVGQQPSSFDISFVGLRCVMAPRMTCMQQ
jgi:NAD(P)-dependent dehydrogenase (short-subunit alcohol dehydrogenase family)